MQPTRTEFAGKFNEHQVPSSALQGNPLGDPSIRTLWVYLPPGYTDSQAYRYPTIYVIQGFTGKVDAWWDSDPFRPNVPELIDQLFRRADVPPALVVLVDAFTSLGGSQYVNSPAVGRYLDYLCDDVVSYVDERYATMRSPEGRALTGKSSGGYGAMTVPMRRPDVFGSFASHAGDALFEYCHMPGIAVSARALRDIYDGSIEAFWIDFRSRPAFTKQSDFDLLSTYAMSACYSPDENGTVVLPFDPATGVLRQEIWERWLNNDPVRMAPLYASALRSMRSIYIDAGRRDEFFLDVGANAFAAELRKLGVPHRFELFDGTHRSFEYRYPIAWKYLAEQFSQSPV